MRRVNVLSFVSLDGVMQAPGRPDEDSSYGFENGGWMASYFAEADAVAGVLIEKQMKSTDLLLGSRTFDIFEAYRPQYTEYWMGVSEATKYMNE